MYVCGGGEIVSLIKFLVGIVENEVNYIFSPHDMISLERLLMNIINFEGGPGGCLAPPSPRVCP